MHDLFMIGGVAESVVSGESRIVRIVRGGGGETVRVWLRFEREFRSRLELVVTGSDDVLAPVEFGTVSHSRHY